MTRRVVPVNRVKEAKQRVEGPPVRSAPPSPAEREIEARARLFNALADLAEFALRVLKEEYSADR